MTWFKKTPKTPPQKPPRFRIIEEELRNGRSRFNVEEHSLGRYFYICHFKTAEEAREFINVALGGEVVMTRIEGYYGGER